MYDDFTQLDNGLWMDNKTKKIGVLMPSPNGGWYVADTREQVQKEVNSYYQGHKKEHYKEIADKWEKKWKEATNYKDRALAESQRNAWKKNYDEAFKKETSFKDLYDNPKEEKNYSKMIDYNAKTRKGRYANYATIDVVKQDKEIESDIKSVFTYQNEKTMGTLEKEPLKRYYDKYGKENVDRVWGNLDKKYAVIQGVTMDSEGLRYNTLVEKDKYSPEAIQYYQNATEQAWKNYSGDSKEYNRYVNSAEKEFLEFDSKRSSWEKGKSAFYNDIQNAKTEDDLQRILNEHDSVRTNTRKESAQFMKEWSVKAKEIRSKEIPTLDEEVRNLVKQNYGEIDMNDLYDEELDAITKVAQKNIEEMKGSSPSEKWTEKDKYEYDLYKRAKENPDSIDPMTENSTDWDALDKKWSNRYDYDKEQEAFTGTSKEDKFKGINLTEAPSKTSQYTMLKSTTYKKGLNRAIDLNLSSTSNTAGKDAEILNSVVGQLSDGIWENSPNMDRYWTNMDFTDNEGKIKMNVPREYYNWEAESSSYRRPASNPFHDRTDEQVRTYIADKAKQIVKVNMEDNSSLGKWSRDNNNVVEYMGGHNAKNITVADVYSFYDRVKGRPGKSYKTYGKTSVSKDEVDNIKAQVERFKRRKGSKKNSNNSLDWTYDRNSL